MAAQGLDYDRLSIILLEAVFEDDATVCDKYNISTRTLQRYRKLMSEDGHLSAIVGSKKAEMEKDWLGAIAPALRSCVKYVETVANSTNQKSPEMVHAVSGAFKLMADAKLAVQIVEAEIELSRVSQTTHQPIAQVEKQNQLTNGTSGSNYN